MKTISERIRATLRRNLKSLIIFWGVGAIVIFIGFTAVLSLSGSSIKVFGDMRVFLEILAIAVVAPPVVWIIGKLTILLV